MTHYRMLDRAPSVVITSNRNELKVYQNNVVYLNNGDNFELRFFNPLQEKIGVEIIFNGTRKGDGFLVLNPGQDVILDRFLDEQRKMLFETYTINGNNKEAVEAAEKNGLIIFNFYKERYSYHYNDIKDVNVVYDFPPKPYKEKKSKYKNKGILGNSGPLGTFYSQSISDMNTTNTSTFNSPGIYTTERGFSFSNTNVTLDSFDLNEIETGRVERGDYSNQTLKNVNAQFKNNSFYTIEYKIMPYSEKNYDVTEIRQYCPECRYRLRKKTWKFCPSCGEKL